MFLQERPILPEYSTSIGVVLIVHMFPVQFLPLFSHSRQIATLWAMENKNIITVQSGPTQYDVFRRS